MCHRKISFFCRIRTSQLLITEKKVFCRLKICLLLRKFFIILDFLMSTTLVFLRQSTYFSTYCPCTNQLELFARVIKHSTPALCISSNSFVDFRHIYKGHKDEINIGRLMYILYIKNHSIISTDQIVTSISIPASKFRCAFQVPI